jgi:hypothetical protein
MKSLSETYSLLRENSYYKQLKDHFLPKVDQDIKVWGKKLYGGYGSAEDYSVEGELLEVSDKGLHILWKKIDPPEAFKKPEDEIFIPFSQIAASQKSDPWGSDLPMSKAAKKKQDKYIDDEMKGWEEDEKLQAEVDKKDFTLEIVNKKKTGEKSNDYDYIFDGRVNGTVTTHINDTGEEKVFNYRYTQKFNSGSIVYPSNIMQRFQKAIDDYNFNNRLTNKGKELGDLYDNL